VFLMRATVFSSASLSLLCLVEVDTFP